MFLLQDSNAIIIFNILFERRRKVE